MRRIYCKSLVLMVKFSMLEIWGVSMPCKEERERLLIVSFDAVGSEELRLFGSDSNFRRLFSNGRIYQNLDTIMVSNTYPVHASVSTGRLPCEHGLIANTALEPESGHGWNWDSSVLKAKPIWKAAWEKGLETATIMWPVTGYAGRSLKHNLPEILVAPGQSMVGEYLAAGSKLLCIRSYLRFGRILNRNDAGGQPEKDLFATSVLEDLFVRRKGKQPDLSLLHLTEYDSACHIWGKGSPQSLEALKGLDSNLGRILKAASPGTKVIVFSDHSQLNFDEFCDPDGLSMERFGNDGHRRFYFYYCGGTCFCFPRHLSEQMQCDLQAFCLGLGGVERLLTETEMRQSGFMDRGAVFGLSARAGVVFDNKIREKAEHGYPLDKEHYKVFIATSWQEESPCSSVLDVTRLAAKVLKLDYKEGIL